MSGVAVLMPSLERADNLARVLDNLDDTRGDIPYAVYCMLDAGDDKSRDVCERRGVLYHTDDRGWFARRTDELFGLTSEPWVFTGTDDIVFPDAWCDRMFEAKQPGWKVIAPNDGHNPNGTNFLVNREYVETYGGHWNTPGHIFHPAYMHNFTDNELIEVAVVRGVFGRTMDVLVESTHPVWGNAEDDDTYRRARLRYDYDAELFGRRCHLWR